MGKQPEKNKNLKAAIQSQYGEKVYGWIGYADEKKEHPLVELIEKIAKELKFAPSYFYTIAIGEGLGTTYVDDSLNPTNYETIQEIVNNASVQSTVLRTDLPIDGFNSLGVDDFGSEFNRYKQYLPKDYNEGDEYKNRRVINEKSESRVSAEFKNLESALWAFGATLAHRKDTFEKHRKENRYKLPTEDEQAFWTYVYYQGEGRAKKYLQNNGELSFKKKAPSTMTQVRKLAIERVGTWRYVQAKSIFSN